MPPRLRTSSRVAVTVVAVALLAACSAGGEAGPTTAPTSPTVSATTDPPPAVTATTLSSPEPTPTTTTSSTTSTTTSTTSPSTTVIPTTTQPPLPAFATHADEAGDFSIDYPVTWTVEVDPLGAVFTAPPRASGVAPSTVETSSTRSPVGSLADIAAGLLADDIENLDDYEILTDEATVLDGVEAHVMVYAGFGLGGNTITELVVTTNAERLVTFRFTSSIDAYERDRLAFAAMVESIDFR